MESLILMLLFALANSEDLSEALPKFLSGNGFRYVQMVENGWRQMSQRLSLDIAKGGRSFVKTSKMDEFLDTYHFRNFDTQGRDATKLILNSRYTVDSKQ
jgi:hypothetical protein